MKIIIYQNREVYKEESKIGNDSENKVETLEFEFPKEYEDFKKYIEFQIKGEKYVDLIEDNKYVITREVAKYGKIKTQVVLKKNTENDVMIFKSDVFTLTVSNSINATENLIYTGGVDLIKKIVTKNNEQDFRLDALEADNTTNKENISNLQNELAVSPTQPTTREKVWVKIGKNKFDKLGNIENIGTNESRTINLKLEPNTTYTMSSNISKSSNNTADLFFASGYNVSVSTDANGVWNGQTRTVTSDENGYVTVAYRKQLTSQAPNLIDAWYQIEQGSTATTYEEYVEPVIYVKNNNVYEEFIKKQEDSGWIPLILKDGISVSTVNNIKQVPQCRKIGNHVFVRGHISTKWKSGSNKNIAILPYKPKQNVYKMVPLTQTNLARIFIAPNRNYGNRVDT